MARKKVMTSVYLEPEQLRGLKILSKRSRIPMAVMIRDAVAEYLDDRRDAIPAEDADPRQLEIPGSQ